ncbi:acyl-coenzyme A thioesterase 1-like [Aulostomus maculatus]
MTSQVQLRLLPRARCLYDEPLQVKVVGLKMRQVVTVSARMTDERGVVFNSSATYRADSSGEIDLERDSSLSGSYVGVEPMGLLWSMKASTPHKNFYMSRVLNPNVVKFSVHEGWEVEDRVLAEATNERLLMSDGVCRVPIIRENFSGVLFIPQGEGLFPGVLDLNTFMSERRASLLANRGFVVLCVPVFRDKPAKVKQMHLDYFKEAIEFLKQHPKVSCKGVGVIGRSKAGDIALSIASFVPGVAAVVWINGCSANVAVPLYYKKTQILSAIGSDMSQVILTESGASLIKYCLNNPLAGESKDSLVPVEGAKAQFLFVASEDDLNWDSKAYMDQLVDRLKRHGRANFKTVCYPRAGHLLEPPYGPYSSSGFHGVLRSPVMWGGEPKAHAAAEVHLWRKIQKFLRAQLSPDVSQMKAQL